MDRKKFKLFTDLMLESLVKYTQLHTGIRLSGKLILSIRSKPLQKNTEDEDEKIEDRNTIVEHLISRVFITSEKIYPCVDLLILNVNTKGDITITMRIAGFEPCPFQNGMYDFPGPFNWLINEEIINQKTKIKDERFRKQKDLIRENLRASLQNLE